MKTQFLNIRTLALLVLLSGAAYAFVGNKPKANTASCQVAVRTCGLSNASAEATKVGSTCAPANTATPSCKTEKPACGVSSASAEATKVSGACAPANATKVSCKTEAPACGSKASAEAIKVNATCAPANATKVSCKTEAPACGSKASAEATEATGACATANTAMPSCKTEAQASFAGINFLNPSPAASKASTDSFRTVNTLEASAELPEPKVTTAKEALEAPGDSLEILFKGLNFVSPWDMMDFLEDQDEGNFHCNAVQFNGKQMDTAKMVITSKGTLTISEGKDGAKVPFRVYLRRNGVVVQNCSSTNNSIHVSEVEVSKILKVAAPGDDLIIAPLQKVNGYGKRILRVSDIPGKGC